MTAMRPPSSVLRLPRAAGAAALVAAVIIGLLTAPAALASKRIYWSNHNANKISFANVDGTGGADLATTGANVDGPLGTALHPSAGRIYWGNYNEGQPISFANLDGGGGGGNLNTAGASGVPTDGYAAGIAVDPATGRVYWANEQVGDGNISFANLDGSGGGDLNTGAATVDCPVGVAVDSPSGKIYWGNCSAPPKISFANLDGSGGGDLNTGAATVNDPQGIALDPSTGKLYWTNQGADKIAFLDLNTGAAGDLSIAGATVNNPRGPTIDAGAGRIYWANDGGPPAISFANLDGSGGGNLATTGATSGGATFPVLLDVPQAAGAPAVTGAATTGSKLSCSQGSWAADIVSSFFYRAPTSFAFQWSRDGAEIAGATGSSLTADKAGAYRCTVTAKNEAGSASQTSQPHAVSLPAFGVRTLATLTLAAKLIPGGGPLKVRVTNDNAFPITGELSARTVGKVNVSKRRLVKLRAKAFAVGAKARRTVSLRLPKALRRTLKRTRRLKLSLAAKVKDPAGNTRTVRKKITPKLKKKRKRASVASK